MDTGTFLDALGLGVLEGATEFIPVSSTGHLVLASHFLGFEDPGNTFKILIQLGAVLAVLSVYASKLIGILRALPHDPRARRFVAAVIIAFLPAAIIGALTIDFITSVLLDTPTLIAVVLVIGGVVLLFVDRLEHNPTRFDIMDYPIPMALGIGFFQVLSLVPGVSRSGATIVGGLLFGGDKRSAAEFSFFLAMPTMLGAFVLDIYKNWDTLDWGQIQTVAVGFVAAFLSALVVVRWLLGYVSRHGFALFAWWRIVVGGVALVLLLFGV
jgi:undecaprenyl-diphosphatase